jgi:hypothetical protein
MTLATPISDLRADHAYGRPGGRLHDRDDGHLRGDLHDVCHGGHCRAGRDGRHRGKSDGRASSDSGAKGASESVEPASDPL